MTKRILAGELALTSNREAKVHGHGQILLNSLNKVLNDCLQYPSAIALDFRFLGQDIETLLKTSATNIADYDGLQMSSSCQETAVSDFGLSAEWTIMQRDILDIVAKLSKQSPEKVEQHTSFFHLGLDSISAAQIAANLREKGWNVASVEVIEVLFFIHSLSGQNMLIIMYPTSIHPLYSYLLTLKRKSSYQKIISTESSNFRLTIENSGLKYVFAIPSRAPT